MFLLKATKVRNIWVSSTVVLAVTSIAFYFSWIVWLWALGRRQEMGFDLSGFFHFFSHPNDAWDFIVEVNSTGSWALGIVLWIVWAIEAAIIFGMSFFAAFLVGSSEPFCEKCHQWCDENENVLATGPSSDLAEFVRRMEMKDFGYLESLGISSEGALDLIKLGVHTCSRCLSLNTLTATRIQIKTKKGEKEVKESEILSNLLLTASDVRALERVAEKMYAAQS